MTFIIRKIRRRPNGQEVVRDQPVLKSELTVGRATDCDIYLPDLRVSLNHAQIEAAGTSIRVVATSDRPVQVKNKLGNRFVFSHKDQAEVEIGPYQLKIYKEEGSDSIVVATERIEEKTPTLQPEDESKLFSLKKTLPGKRSSAWFLTVLAVAGSIFVPLYYFYTDRKADVAEPIQTRADQELIGIRSDQWWLSGEMSTAHTSLADNCNSCHLNAFESVKDETCLSSGCHDSLRNHADTTDLKTAREPLSPFGMMLRQTADFVGKADMRCASCHLEHNGRDGIILTTESLCGDCHNEMDTRLADTDLINVGYFDKDHPNFRATVVVEPDRQNPLTRRVSLDENPTSNSGLKFPHDIHMEAGGAVENDLEGLADTYGFGEKLVCEDCHKANTAGALFLPIQMEKHCGMCHSLGFDKDPETGYVRTLRHGEPEDVVASMRDFYNSTAAVLFESSNEVGGRRRPGDVARLRQDRRLVDALVGADERSNDKIREIFNEGGACFDCHTIVQPSDPESVDYNISPVSVEETFMPKAIFHHDSHDNMDCVDCHDAETSGEASDVLMPGIDNCLDCHRGETTVNFIPSNCLMCHEYHDEDHVPFMTPAKTSRHAALWPSRKNDTADNSAIAAAMELSTTIAGGK